MTCRKISAGNNIKAQAGVIGFWTPFAPRRRARQFMSASGGSGHRADIANRSFMTHQRHEWLEIAALQLASEPYFSGSEDLL
jgi:hypothetical protein